VTGYFNYEFCAVDLIIQPDAISFIRKTGYDSRRRRTVSRSKKLAVTDKTRPPATLRRGQCHL